MYKTDPTVPREPSSFREAVKSHSGAVGGAEPRGGVAAVPQRGSLPVSDTERQARLPPDAIAAIAHEEFVEGG
jgi:hypothetical protein